MLHKWKSQSSKNDTVDKNQLGGQWMLEIFFAPLTAIFKQIFQELNGNDLYSQKEFRF
jgi:hypothetical protein